MPASRFTVATTLVAALLSTACSTTLDAKQRADSGVKLAGDAPDDHTPSALPSAAAPGRPGTETQAPTSGPSLSGPVPAAGDSPQARRLGGSGGSSTGSGSAGPTGAGSLSSQGVTATTIKIGVVLVDFGGLQNVNGFKTGDPRVQSQAIADHLNGVGGVAGRKIVLTFATLSASSSNFESDEQAMCTQFTEDDKVFAVVYALNSMGKTFLACLAAHNTPLISSGGGVADRTYMDRYSRFYLTPSSPNMTRMAKAYVDSLARQGFFGAGSKVGFIRVDDAPFQRAAQQSLIPQLAKYGVTATEAVVNSQKSLSETASQLPAIALRFQQGGINRVMFLDNGQIAPLFAAQAAGQGYYPRYGLTSVSLPDAMRLNVPARALQDAVGMGWMPALDVMASRDSFTNDAIKTCAKVMTAAGQGGVDRTGTWSQRAYCDDFFLLRQALTGRSAVTPSVLTLGAEALRGSYQSPMTFDTSFGAARHDGATAYKDLRWDASCTCFVYVGAARPLP